MMSESLGTALIVAFTSTALAAGATREVIVPAGTVLRVQLESSVA